MQNNKNFSTLPYLGQERTQKFGGIILTFLALSFFIFFAINPTISTILKLQKEIDDNQYVSDQLDIKIKNLSKLRVAYANLQNDLPITTDAISKEADVQLLFAQIQAASQKANIKIKRLQNLEVELIRNNRKPDKKYYSYSFSIAGNGPFENIHNFVSTITNMQRIINIDLFSINSTSGLDNQSLGFNINGTAFFKE